MFENLIKILELIIKKLESTKKKKFWPLRKQHLPCFDWLNKFIPFSTPLFDAKEFLDISGM